MNLIKLAIERPVAVLSIVFMVVLMGWGALRTIPIQLTPDVRKPLIQVITQWSGAAPAEVEREIVDRQEEAFTGLEGLEEIVSSSQASRSFVSLEFNIEQNMDRALLLVGNRLNRITGMPAEADEPRIRTRDSNDNPIAWFTVQTVPGNSRPIRSYGDFVDDTVRDRLERIQGVALVNVYGGNESEIRIIVER